GRGWVPWWRSLWAGTACVWKTRRTGSLSDTPFTSTRSSLPGSQPSLLYHRLVGRASRSPTARYIGATLAWIRTHPEQARLHTEKTRARRKSAPGAAPTKAEWLERVRWF